MVQWFEYIFISIFLSTYIYLSIYIYIYIYLSIGLSVCLFVYLSIYSRRSFEFCWSRIILWILSWHSCCVRQTWITQLILAISPWDYLSLTRKDSRIHMHVLTVYVKEGLLFAQDLSVENSADSFLCFRLALLHSVSYFFFLYWSPSSS